MALVMQFLELVPGRVSFFKEQARVQGISSEESLAALFKLAKVLEKELPLAMVGPWSRALARALQLLVVALCRGPNLPWWVQPTVYCPLEKAFFLVSRVLDMALVVRFEERNPL